MTRSAQLPASPSSNDPAMSRGRPVSEDALIAMTYLARGAIWIGGASILATALLVTTDVLLRKLAGFTLAGAHEITGYMFAVATSWAFAFTLREKGNVRIDLVYRAVPAFGQRLLDLTAFLAFGALLAVMALSVYSVLAVSWQRGTISVTPLRTPLAIPQAFWFAGYVLALLMWAAIAWRVVAGDRRIREELLSPKGITEEIAEEFESLNISRGEAPDRDSPTRSTRIGELRQ